VLSSNHSPSMDGITIVVVCREMSSINFVDVLFLFEKKREEREVDVLSSASSKKMISGWDGWREGPGEDIKGGKRGDKCKRN
jgi:hypothetical protein